MSHLLLAVDGGNSKTDLALLRRDGSVVASVRGPGSSPHHLGLDAAIDLIGSLIDDACRSAGVRRNGRTLAALGSFFMAGADLASEERALARALRRQGWVDQVQVANDTFAILRAGTDAGWGIAVVAGAGLNCVGRAADGRTARFLSLGAISGDWGAGPDVGLAALGAGVRAEDRRGPPTELAALIAAHFGLRRATDVAIAIHQGVIDEDRLIQLPPLVEFAARHGDAAADQILSRQREEVVALVVAAARRLGFVRRATDVVLGGGQLANRNDGMVRRVTEAVTSALPHARVLVSEAAPIVGASLSALDAVGAPAAARARLRRAFEDNGQGRSG
jgi:N-acetylglucosamine kinase-like BadF-type ATPase